MAHARPPLEQQGQQRTRGPLPPFLLLAGWILLMMTGLGWPEPTQRPILPTQRHILPLAPLYLTPSLPGQLGHPINFGFRCTLVDAAAILDYYGANLPQAPLALRLSAAVDYSTEGHGPPWWAYIGWPGQRPLLDVAIEEAAHKAGIHVTAETIVGLNFVRAARAIAQDQPVILNVVRAPDGTYNHSLLAYGEDTRQGRRLLLVMDPNTQVSDWIGPSTLWSETLTSTYITPAGK